MVAEDHPQGTEGASVSAHDDTAVAVALQEADEAIRRAIAAALAGQYSGGALRDLSRVVQAIEYFQSHYM